MYLKKFGKEKLLIILIMVFTIFCLANLSIFAAKYPEKDIIVILPFKAGGGTDTSMRMLQPVLERELGVKLNFVYKPGASGVLGYLEISNSEPDGYTIGAVNWPHVLVPTILKDEPGYKLEDIQPVATYNKDRAVLCVHKDDPWDTFEQLLEDAKKRPNKITCANPVRLAYGPGAIYRMEEATGIKLKTIWFDGGSKSAQGFLGGHTDAWLINGSVMRKYPDEIKPLAVLGEKRTSYFPDTPTFAEIGYPSVVSFTYRAIVVPGGTDPTKIDILSKAIGNAVSDPEFQKLMKEKGVDPFYLDTPEFEKFSKKEYEDTKALIEKFE